MTLKGNSFRDISGRGPKVGGGIVMHAVNNAWTDVVGNAFETESTVSILMEGNVFDGVKTPIMTGGGGKILAVNSASAGTACKSALGRDCVANSSRRQRATLPNLHFLIILLQDDPARGLPSY